MKLSSRLPLRWRNRVAMWRYTCLCARFDYARLRSERHSRRDALRLALQWAFEPPPF